MQDADNISDVDFIEFWLVMLSSLLGGLLGGLLG